MKKQRENNKQNLIIALCIAAVLFAWGMIYVFFNTGRGNSDVIGTQEIMGVPVIDEVTLSELTRGREQVDLDTELVYFEGVKAPAEKDKQRVYISQNPNTKNWEGTLSTGSGDCNIYFTGENDFSDKQSLIETGTPCEFLIVSDTSYSYGNLIVSGLPIVSIEYNSEEVLKRHEKTEAEITVTDPEGFSGDDEKTAGSALRQHCTFHIRGNSSTYFEKIGYRISLRSEKGTKVKRNLLGMRNDDDWILNPLYTDTTKVREKVAYTLWNEIAETEESGTYSSKIEYCELLINGEYRGLYGMMYPVDKKMLGLREGDILYKLNTWEYASDEDFKKYADSLYVLTEDRIETAEIKYPKTTQHDFSWEPLSLFQQYVYNSLPVEALLKQGITLNRDSVLTYSLFCILTHAEDNAWKNTFLIAKKTNTGYELTRDIWDLNYTFGDRFFGNLDAYFVRNEQGSAYSMEVKSDYPYEYATMLKADETQTLSNTAEKWKKWRDSGLSAEHVNALAREYMEILIRSGAMEREKERWPETGPSEDLSSLTSWVDHRFEFLDNYFGY